MLIQSFPRTFEAAQDSLRNNESLATLSLEAAEAIARAVHRGKLDFGLFLHFIALKQQARMLYLRSLLDKVLGKKDPQTVVETKEQPAEEPPGGRISEEVPTQVKKSNKYRKRNKKKSKKEPQIVDSDPLDLSKSLIPQVATGSNVARENDISLEPTQSETDEPDQVSILTPHAQRVTDRYNNDSLSHKEAQIATKSEEETIANDNYVGRTDDLGIVKTGKPFHIATIVDQSWTKAGIPLLGMSEHLQKYLQETRLRS